MIGYAVALKRTVSYVVNLAEFFLNNAISHFIAVLCTSGFS